MTNAEAKITEILMLFPEIVFDAALEANGLRKDDPEIAQHLPAFRALMDGFRAVIEENLRGAERTERERYLQANIPQLLEQAALGTMAESTASFGIRLTNAIVLRLPAHERAGATAWFAAFFGEYMRRLIETGVESMERRRAAPAAP